ENLADAVFQLKKGDEVVKLVKESDTVYRVAMADEVNAVETFKTVASGNIVITGVDTDSDYTLVETEAPVGYNMLTKPVEVEEVKADNTTVVDVENKTGIELPSTGGIGTTIFYALGAVMVIGAGVLLVAKKRMSVEG
ncbi:MAG: LPXTG cell wall anchor domain-containing protein, partial [Clostridia bacterium]|nr:LPXTG cell wall anchor domain-containing protein [Clostridia bacterium]